MILGISGCTALLVTGFGIRDSIKNVADYQFNEISLYDYSVTLSNGADADTEAKLLETGGVNTYTIEKKGVRKMIYQTAWKQDGVVGGLVEISMEIPGEMPHYMRK